MRMLNNYGHNLKTKIVLFPFLKNRQIEINLIVISRVYQDHFIPIPIDNLILKVKYHKNKTLIKLQLIWFLIIKELRIRVKLATKLDTKI